MIARAVPLLFAASLVAASAQAQTALAPTPPNARPVLDRFNQDWAGDTAKVFEIGVDGTLLRGTVSLVTPDFVQLTQLPDKERGVTATIPWSGIRYWIAYPAAAAK